MKKFTVGKPIPPEQLRFIRGGEDVAVSHKCDDNETLCKVTTAFNGGGVNRGVGCASDGFNCAAKAMEAYNAQGIPSSMISSITCSC